MVSSATGSENRPELGHDTMVVLTSGAEVVRRQVPDLARALLLVTGGGKAARAVPGWRATYHMDDPAYEPDLWIRTSEPVLWIKQDDHGPWETDATGKCDSCGRRHKGVMAIFTVLRPDEY
jgi:hypothetical protein